MALISNFYEATNPMLDSNGYMSICKKCVGEIYSQYFSIYNNIEDALKLTCQDLDVRFSKDTLKQTQSHVDGVLAKGKKADKVFGIYKSKLTSTGKNNEDIDSFRFKDSNNYENKVSLSVNNIESDNADFEMTDNIRKFWGFGKFTKNDYEYLTDKFTEYINNYECDNPVMEELLKQAAYESLEIRNKRIEGQDVSKNLTNLQTLLGSANIKPNQETGANASDQIAFGLLIKKWENEEPIPEPDEEWKDVDGIRKYIRVWFLGHLCKMLGIANEYSSEYEKEMSALRVEMPSNDLSLDELEEGE